MRKTHFAMPGPTAKGGATNADILASAVTSKKTGQCIKVAGKPVNVEDAEDVWDTCDIATPLIECLIKGRAKI